MDLDEAPQGKERWGRASSIDASITPPPLLNSLARRLEEELTRTACARGLFGEG